MLQENIDKAKERFAELIAGQEKRIEDMKNGGKSPDYASMDKIIIGVIPGDGAGPRLMKQALRAVNYLLAEPIASGRIEIRQIPGLDVENRDKVRQSIPDDSRKALHECDIILKGPLDNTSIKGLGSSVAAIRAELGLSINLRPVKNPNKGYDWVMFRENIEGEYIWGSKGIQVDEDIAVDFRVQTKQQSTHLARAAFNYARANGRKHVTAITKNNVIRLTDGNLLEICREVAKEYPDIEYDERLVDATAAKLGDPDYNKNLEVMILPNLFGDIISDIAAELAGGLGTAGSANIGTKYSLFEAIHGTAQTLINLGRGDYADPSSIMRATAMMMAHIGYIKEANILNEALDICGYTERKLVITSFKEDASTVEYSDYILETVKKLQARSMVNN